MYNNAKTTLPANPKLLYNICTMLVQRRRRWADVVQMLYKTLCILGCNENAGSAIQTLAKSWRIVLFRLVGILIQVRTCVKFNTVIQTIGVKVHNLLDEMPSQKEVRLKSTINFCTKSVKPDQSKYTILSLKANNHV